MAGRSVHLTTLFPGQAWTSSQSVLRANTFACNWQQPFLNDSAEGRRMTLEIISWSISTKVWDRARILPTELCGLVETALSGSSRQLTLNKGAPGDQVWDLLCVQLASYLERGPLMWWYDDRCKGSISVQGCFSWALSAPEKEPMYPLKTILIRHHGI